MVNSIEFFFFIVLVLNFFFFYYLRNKIIYKEIKEFYVDLIFSFLNTLVNYECDCF